MTGKALCEFLTEEGVNGFSARIVDTSYNLPTREWFFGDFARGMARNLHTLGLTAYRTDQNDCDDYAMLLATLARVCHSLTKHTVSTLAVGMFHYMTSAGLWHAIIFTVVKEDGYKLLFMEPQTQQEAKLTVEEINSCDFYYI